MGPALLGVGPSKGNAAVLPLLHYGAFPGQFFAGDQSLGQMLRVDHWVDQLAQEHLPFFRDRVR